MEIGEAKLPIKSDGEAAVAISPAERQRIEVLEEYRLEVSQRLRERESQRLDAANFWKDKVIAPAIVVILTVVLGGYAVPKALEVSQQKQRAREVRADMLEDIARRTGEMQASLDSYAEAVDTYWRDAARLNAEIGEYILKRDLGLITPADFTRQIASAEVDRQRASDRLDVAAEAYEKQYKSFLPWVNRTRVRITALYGDRDGTVFLSQVLGRIADSAVSADAAMNRKQELYDGAVNHQLRSIVALGDSFRAKEIRSRDYHARLTKMLDQLRVLERIDGPARELDAEATAAALQALQIMQPVA
jgi:hypothetical protein